MSNRPNTDKLTINRWAEEDRPREKMMLKGPQALSNAELLAILIGSGNRNESAVSLMQRVLQACHNDLHALGRWELADFQKFKGLGMAKSISIMAALELGRRRTEDLAMQRPCINTSADIYAIFNPLLRDLSTEEFWILLLNQARRVIDKVCISKGGIDQTAVDIRVILREALLQRATQLVAVHNHPSGSTTPSQQDKTLTAHIKKSAEVLNIRLIDHVIVGDGAFFSFNDAGMI